MGCQGSKSATAAHAPVSKPEATLLSTAEQKVEEAQSAAAPAPLKVKVDSAQGLRHADLCSQHSEVFVEVMIEGKPCSKVTTPIVCGKPEEKSGAKPCIDVDFQFEAELKGFVAGDKVVFTVKDKDLLTSDVLGTATVADGAFGGKLELEAAGDGYSAFLMVQLGDGYGSLWEEAAEELQDIAVRRRCWRAWKELAESSELVTSGDPLKVLEGLDKGAEAFAEAASGATHVLQETLEEVIETRGAVCYSCW